jgi:aminopeptidase N
MERGTGNQTAYRAWAIRFLKPHLTQLGWDAKANETPLDSNLRASLIHTLGLFGDPGTVREARARFTTYLANPSSLNGNLRGPVFLTVGRNADEATWEKLHSLARNADSFEQKRALYSALTTVRDPALASKTLALSLTNELIAPDAARIVSRVSYDGEHPELAWDFAREHLEALLAKLPALGVNDYVPGIFRGFSDAARADELEAFAKANLPPSVGHSVAKAADEIRFQADFKQRALPEIDAWWKAKK